MSYELNRKRTYDWVKRIDWKKFLTFEYHVMEDAIGEEKFFALLERMNKTHVYFTNRPVELMKREFVILFSSEYTVPELCLMLDMSEKTVYRILNEKTKKTDTGQVRLEL